MPSPHVQFRIQQEVYDWVCIQAQRDGISAVDFIKRLVVDAALVDQARPLVVPEQVEELVSVGVATKPVAKPKPRPVPTKQEQRPISTLNAFQNHPRCSDWECRGRLTDNGVCVKCKKKRWAS